MFCRVFLIHRSTCAINDTYQQSKAETYESETGNNIVVLPSYVLVLSRVRVGRCNFVNNSTRQSKLADDTSHFAHTLLPTNNFFTHEFGFYRHAGSVPFK